MILKFFQKVIIQRDVICSVAINLTMHDITIATIPTGQKQQRQEKIDRPI
jgi:hypothetical protein